MIRTALIATALMVAGQAHATAAQNDAASAGPETVPCLPTRNIQQAQAGIDGKWYVRMSGGKWWRNRMECAALRPPRGLVHTSPIGSQCKGDVLQVVDFSMGGMQFGGCAFDDWERVDKPAPTRPPKKPK